MSSFCIIYQFRKILHILRNNFRLLLVIFCRDHEIEFYLSRETLSAEIFRTKNTFLLFLGFETKKLGLLAKILRHFFKNAFEVSRGKIQEIFCFETSGFNNLFEIWLKKIRTFIKKLPTRLSTSPSSTPEDNLRKKNFKKFTEFWSFSDLLQFFVVLWLRKFDGALKSASRLSTGTTWGKSILSVKSVLQSFFWNLSEKFSDFWRKLSNSDVEMRYQMSSQFFRGNFSKKKGLCYQFQALRG